MSITPPPPPETPGSSAHTAIAVGIGATVGVGALVLGAPILLPLIGITGIGSIIAGSAITPFVGTLLGGWLGWKVGGKT